MTFKKGKYNLIFMLMFMLIIGVFGYQIYEATLPTEITVPANPDAEGDGNDQPQDNKPDTPTNPGSSEEQPALPDGDVQEDDPNAPANPQRYTTAYLNYAIDKLFKGNYKSTYNKTMTNTAKVPLLGDIKVTQKIKGNIDKSGNKSLEKLTFEAEGSQKDMAVNLIRGFYFDGDTVVKYQTAKYNYDFSTAQQQEMSREEYFNNYIINLADKPAYKIAGARMISSETNESGRNYYVISATVNVSDLSSCGYTRYYESTGDLKNVKAVSASFTFYVYAGSAQVFKIVSNEQYSGTNPQFGVPVDTKITSTQTFSVFTDQFDIPRP